MELERLPVSNPGFVLPFARSLERNEKALMLIEEDRMTADLRAEHRWQSIYVQRGESIVEFPRDLGPSRDFKGIGGFILLSGGEDSVASIMDMADVERGENRIKAVLDEAKENSTLIHDAIELLEQKRTLVNRNTRTLRRDYGLPTVERTQF